MSPLCVMMNRQPSPELRCCHLSGSKECRVSFLFLVTALIWRSPQSQVAPLAVCSSAVQNNFLEDDDYTASSANPNYRSVLQPDSSIKPPDSRSAQSTESISTVQHDDRRENRAIKNLTARLWVVGYLLDHDPPRLHLISKCFPYHNCLGGVGRGS